MSEHAMPAPDPPSKPPAGSESQDKANSSAPGAEPGSRGSGWATLLLILMATLSCLSIPSLLIWLPVEKRAEQRREWSE